MVNFFEFPMFDFSHLSETVIIKKIMNGTIALDVIRVQER